MPIYVYRNLETGEVVENLCPTYEPDKYKPGEDWQLVIQTSTIVFGSMVFGDDDYSRRYWNNGSQEISLPNRTQGQTNVNSILRKYGKKGKPLEARTDIDPTKLTKDGIRPPGVKSSLEAPPELSSSQAKGVGLWELAS